MSQSVTHACPDICPRAGPALTALGYEVETRALTSGLHAIEIGTRLEGGADPRREGLAYGE